MVTTINSSIEVETLIKIITLGFFGFLFSMVLTPIYTTIAYRYEWWKRSRTEAWGGGEAKVYKKLHAQKHKRNIPTMAGLIFVTGVTLVTVLFNLERSETWLPLAAMLGAGLVGLIDDYINISGQNNGVAGMRSKLKLLLHTLVALIGGWWFYAKLDQHSISLPFVGAIELGILIIALFVFVVIATANAVNITDGLDGLAGGLLATSFGAYSIICLWQGQFYLGAFCLTIVGALLSYTWFNIYPARFFMGDVGSFAMGTALGVVAMLTDTIYVLPIVGLVYAVETLSVIINRTSKKFRNGKKVFISSPIHHHFEAIGWPETKITMRFWVIGQVAGILGIIVYLLGSNS